MKYMTVEKGIQGVNFCTISLFLFDFIKLSTIEHADHTSRIIPIFGFFGKGLLVYLQKGVRL